MKTLAFSLLVSSVLASACGTSQRQSRLETAAIAGKSPSADRRAPEEVAAGVVSAVDHVRGSVSEATERAVGWHKLPAETLPVNAILDEKRSPDGSFSSGTVAEGVLLNAAELEFEGKFHSIIERHRRHKTRWGTLELVQVIELAAEHVATKLPGAPLRVGNMSAKKGGDIRWSRSHNSGRDADLAFYVVEAETGKSVPAPDLLRFDENGVPSGRPDLRFDVARNWLLVEALVSQTDVNIQWLFISLPLKQMLLDEAARVGASEETIRRAAEVLHQPTDALPHADHFHLRIGCSRDDRLDGCLDYGPQWDWLDWHRDAMLARSMAVSAVFKDEKARPEDRERALEFLSNIRSPFAADVAGVWGFWDPNETVRKKAIATASDQYSWTANALVQVQKLAASADPGGREQRVAYSILRRSRDPLSRDFAVTRLADVSLPAAERRLAAEALSHFMDRPLVPLLIDSLGDADGEVREAAADVLRRITNHTEGVDWRKANDEKRVAGLQRWNDFWTARAAVSRDQLLAEGFRDAGIDVETTVSVRHIDGLMELLRADDAYLRYNANRTIRELTGRWAPLEQLDGRALHKYWSKWWKKNRDRVLEGELGGKS